MRLRNRIYIDIQFSRFPERFQENFSPISLLSTEFSIDKQDFSLRILSSFIFLYITQPNYTCLCVCTIMMMLKFLKKGRKNTSSIERDRYPIFQISRTISGKFLTDIFNSSIPLSSLHTSPALRRTTLFQIDVFVYNCDF